MPRLKMLVEVRKNGDFFLKAPVDELVEFFDMNTSVVSRKAGMSYGQYVAKMEAEGRK